MADWKRLSKISILLMFLSKIRELLIPLFVTLFAGGTYGITAWVFPLFIIGLLIYCVFYWLFFRYMFEDNELRIKKGIFVKKHRYIQKNRVQSVAVHSPLLHRLFNVVKVKIETAGGGMEAEAELVAIPENQANSIREALGNRDNKEKRESTSITADCDSYEYNKTADDPYSITYKVSWKAIILAGVTSGKVGLVFSAAAAVFSQIDQLLPKGFYEESFGTLLSMGTYLLTGIFVMLALIAWLVSILITIKQYGNFEIRKSENEIIISRGILEKRELTLQLDRVTSVRYISNPIRQWLGYWSIYVDSAGGGLKEEQLSTVLLPLGDKAEMKKLTEDILPGAELPQEIIPLPRRAAPRYIIRASFIWWMLLVPVTVWIPRGWLFVLIPLFFTYLGWQRYKDGGFLFSSEHLVLQTRQFNLSCNILPRTRIQSLTFQQSFFQAHRKLYTISANILSTSGGRTFRLKDLEENNTSRNMFDWYRKRNY
ncbi:PH domain-containing protein [Salibacterium salarium]|nr:PH domain-containing protein [Salibacterium salarium]